MACSVFAAAPHKMFPTLPHEMMRARLPAPDPELELSDFDWIGNLGRGGFATVSKVRHRRTFEVFALKMAFYPDDLGAEEESEVIRRTAGAPYVVRCHAVLRGDGGEPASVLEFMDAGTLWDVLYRRGGRGIPEPALAEVAWHCVMGLAQLHSRGVAHLDVKPDNFLANSRGEIKINDFNSSRILYSRTGDPLLVSTTRGTAWYFSPERFVDEACAGPRGAMAADVWGLGVTILEMFLGRLLVLPAVEKPTFDELKEAICNGVPPSLPEDAEASAELRAFVDACLQKDPRRRVTVPQLLNHPFVKRGDVKASSRALRELIVENL